MTWRTAKSLLKLKSQLDAAHPNRSKASDGFIGDPNHQAEGSGSDHNPNKFGVVCAFDITHDPDNGVDIDKLSDALVATKDPRIKYIIAKDLIMVPADSGWNWVTYAGTDPHTNHLHLSVWGDYDNETKWNIGDIDMMDEDGVRMGILAVTGGRLIGDKKDLHEQQVRYYTGKPQDVFYKFLYNLSNGYMVKAWGEIDQLKKALTIAQEAAMSTATPEEVAAVKAFKTAFEKLEIK